MPWVKFSVGSWSHTGPKPHYIVSKKSKADLEGRAKQLIERRLAKEKAL